MSNQIQTTKCVNCKIEQPTSEMFLNHAEFAEMLQIYKEKEIDVDDPHFLEFIKEKCNGLCLTCGAMNASKWGFVKLLIDNNLETEFIEKVIAFYNMTAYYNEIITQKQAIRVTQEVMVNLHMDPVKANAITVALLHIHGKPQHVDEHEKNLMVSFRNRGMSNLDLSRIFQRSKETVYRTLKETGV